MGAKTLTDRGARQPVALPRDRSLLAVTPANGIRYDLHAAAPIRQQDAQVGLVGVAVVVAVATVTQRPSHCE